MKAIEVVSIPVSDQQRSKEFYKKIGFEVLVEAPMGNGETWIGMSLPGQQTSISLVSWFPFKEVAMKPGSLQGLVLLTEDIEKDVAFFKELGIETNKMGLNGIEPGQIMDTPWGRFAHFSDPDGNGLDLHEALK